MSKGSAASIKLIFSSNFFSEETAAYYKKSTDKALKVDPKSIDLTTEGFGEAFNRFKESATTCQDFTEFDDAQFSRGDTHRIDKSLPKNISISAFKDYLSRNQVTDPEFQKFIISVLMQHRIGMPNAIGGSTDVFLLSLKNEGILNPIISTSKEQFSEKLIFHGNDSVDLHLSMPLIVTTPISSTIRKTSRNSLGIEKQTDSVMLPETIGVASIRITLNADKTCAFSDLTIEFKQNNSFPLSSIQAQLIEQKNELMNLTIIRQFQHPVKFPNLTNSKSKFSKVKNLLIDNRWALINFAGSALFGSLGIILIATGIMLPLGIVSIGAALLFSNIVNLDTAKQWFEKITSKPNITEEYLLKPMEASRLILRPSLLPKRTLNIDSAQKLGLQAHEDASSLRSISLPNPKVIVDVDEQKIDRQDQYVPTRNLIS